MNKSTNCVKCTVIIISLIFLSLHAFSLFLHACSEFQLTTHPEAQGCPDIYGDIVVWEDCRNGNSDIYGYNLSIGEEFQITSDESEQNFPAIYGDIVVWEDCRNGNSDIYGYNLSTGEEFQITTNQEYQKYPSIYGDTVVWEDTRNGHLDIYGYRLSTKEEFQITYDPQTQRNPSIYENIVVYDDYRNRPYWQIYGYNLTTGEEFQITTDKSDHEGPAIYGDIVTWQDERNGNWDIYACNLATQVEFQITTDTKIQVHPAVYEDKIVFVQRTIRDIDCIVLYDISTQEMLQISHDEGKPDLPAIFGDIVVWIDLRNGPGDIYGYHMSQDFTPIHKEPEDTSVPKKNLTDKESENGTCLGTLFLLVIILGRVSILIVKKIQIKK